ncbi:MAG: adenosine deaminase family protein [Desulfobacteraceae bacterium]|nr:adenosine deaminase family protein [Desulfobacteraceae bacterium]
MKHQLAIKDRAELESLIRRIPKTDLHVHLDGSIRLDTIIDISKRDKLDLPSYTVDGLNETLFKDQYASLEEYLTTFAYSCAVMQNPEDLERIAYELALDNQAEGVRYMEVRFAPQLHIHDVMNMEDVLMAVNKGLKRAGDEFNARPEIKSGKQPPFHYGIIVCAMRNIGPWSDFYSDFINCFSFSNEEEISRLASLELAKGVLKIRDKQDIPIVGFDLAGAEAGFPAANHWEAFQLAHEGFLPKTVHAGEAYGPESIFQAITELHTDRIGHGYFLFDESRITDPEIKDKKGYTRNLTQFIADRRITIEICLTSNLQTNPAIKSLKDHSFKKMLENNLSTTFCTDNRTVSKTTVTQEIMLALEHFPLDEKSLKNAIIHGFKRSFFPASYIKKRRYVRQCIDYYERVMGDLSSES